MRFIKPTSLQDDSFILDVRSLEEHQLEELKLSSYLQGEGLSMGRDGTITYHFLLEA